MAIVKGFDRLSKKTFKIQPTHVSGYYGTFGEGDKKVFQLDTLGSATREKPAKQSQNLQFDRQSAHELWKLLDREFGFSK